MQSLSFKLLEQIENFKHKLSDAEYKTFVESLSDVNKEEKKIEEKKDNKEYEISYLKISPKLKNPFINRYDEEESNVHTLEYYLDTEVKKVKLKLSTDRFKILQNKLYRPVKYFFDDFSVKDYTLSNDIHFCKCKDHIYENNHNHECVLIQECELILLKIEPFIE